MLTPAQFYLEHYDARDPFGSYLGRDRNGPGHLGSDFNGLPEGTEIPSWCEGVVVANGYSSAIGWYLIIRTIHGGWAGFYHLKAQSPLAVGAAVKFGQFIGLLGNTGTTSNGAHLHTMWSTRSGVPGTGQVEDPWPAIQMIIAAYAAQLKERIDMTQGNFPRRNDKTGTIYWEREPGAPLYALSAAEWADLKQGGAEFVNFAPTVMDEWVARVGLVTNPGLAFAPRAAIEVGNVEVDNVEVIKRLDALPAAIAKAFFEEQKKAGN